MRREWPGGDRLPASKGQPSSGGPSPPQPTVSTNSRSPPARGYRIPAGQAGELTLGGDRGPGAQGGVARRRGVARSPPASVLRRARNPSCTLQPSNDRAVLLLDPHPVVLAIRSAPVSARSRAPCRRGPPAQPAFEQGWQESQRTRQRIRSTNSRVTPASPLPLPNPSCSYPGLSSFLSSVSTLLDGLTPIRLTLPTQHRNDADEPQFVGHRAGEPRGGSDGGGERRVDEECARLNAGLRHFTDAALYGAGEPAQDRGSGSQPHRKEVRVSEPSSPSRWRPAHRPRPPPERGPGGAISRIRNDPVNPLFESERNRIQ